MPDVDDDGHRRLECGDVGEILLRPHAQVDTSGFCRLQEFRDDVLETGFVGQKVIRTEISIFFRRVSGQAPELLVRELGRRRRSHDPRK